MFEDSALAHTRPPNNDQGFAVVDLQVHTVEDLAVTETLGDLFELDKGFNHGGLGGHGVFHSTTLFIPQHMETALNSKKRPPFDPVKIIGLTTEVSEGTEFFIARLFSSHNA